MIVILLIILFLVFAFIPLVRCFIFNVHNVVIYGYRDLYKYIKNKKWMDYNYYGIDIAIGYFGQGKTRYIVKRAMDIYKQYGDTVKIISNIELVGIPYEPLVNFNQLVELQTVDDGRKGTLVLIDEVSNLLSHRNFATFPLELLGVLTQPRKCNIYILASAQRWFMIDKIFRSLTRYAIDLKKYWRFSTFRVYDAWDYETAVNNSMIRHISKGALFFKDDVYATYDTNQKITKDDVSNFLTNEESMVRKGLDSVNRDKDTIKNMSKKLNKIMKR